MYPLTGGIWINMQEKLRNIKLRKFRNIKYEIILELNTSSNHPSVSNHLQVYGKKLLDTWWLRKNNQERPPKLSFWQKRNTLRQTYNKCLREEMGNFLVKRNNGKSKYSNPLARRQFVEFCKRKTELQWTHFQRKGILTKNHVKLRLNFARKVCHNRAVCNYKIWNHQKAYRTRENRS